MSYAPGRARVLAEVHADAAFSNTAAEQTLASLALAAGAVKAGDRLQFEASGEAVNSSGGSVNYMFAFKLGATTLISGQGGLGTAASHRFWVARYELVIESLSVQNASGFVLVGTGTAGTQSLSTSNVLGPGGSGDAAEDLTAAKNVVLTCTMGTADANASVTLKAASLRHIGR